MAPLPTFREISSCIFGLHAAVTVLLVLSVYLSPWCILPAGVLQLIIYVGLLATIEDHTALLDDRLSRLQESHDADKIHTESISRELRLRFGRYCLNPLYLNSRAKPFPDLDTALVAEDHPWLPKCQGLDLPKVCMDNTAWLWVSFASFKEARDAYYTNTASANIV